MVPRENKNNVYAKFGGTNKEYYGIFRTGLCTHIEILKMAIDLKQLQSHSNDNNHQSFLQQIVILK